MTVGKPVTEDDSLPDGKPAPKRMKPSTAVIEVMIGGYKVNCLNTTVRILLLLETQTVTFITRWIVPLVQDLALCQDQKGLEGASETDSSESTGAIAAFHFIASPTPNIRDKITWNPMTHSWVLHLRQSKGTPSQHFTVDPSLPAHSYEEQKKDAYRRAIVMWNKLDSSKRQRIPAPLQPGQTFCSP